jgi:diaminopimelate decarboxylase
MNDRLGPVFDGPRIGRALEALRGLEPGARAFYLYDLDALDRRAARFGAAFAPIAPLAAYALKANTLPAALEVLRDRGLGAEGGSLGELETARAVGFEAARRVLNGNGRTPEEARWAATHGVHSINADHVGELDLLEREASAAGTTVRVALRVNPGVATNGHPHVATGHDEAKFGVAPAEALEALAARARWPHVRLDGLHVHVGSQILDVAPIQRGIEAALALADEAAGRGAPLGFLNLGGGFGVDYTGADEFPLEAHASWLASRVSGRSLEWVLEPGRWLVAPIGALIAEVLWVKRRNGRRFVVLAAGMNDLIRPALYGARHRIVALSPRAGATSPAIVTGPVCESADVFDGEALLPPLETGDLVAILDAGAYGATMASNYNGRLRLAELAMRGGEIRRVRAGERVEDLTSGRCEDSIGP